MGVFDQFADKMCFSADKGRKRADKPLIPADKLPNLADKKGNCNVALNSIGNIT
jgi:hypothetical protein